MESPFLPQFVFLRGSAPPRELLVSAQIEVPSRHSKCLRVMFSGGDFKLDDGVSTSREWLAGVFFGTWVTPSGPLLRLAHGKFCPSADA
jgi:hypothetical protein